MINENLLVEQITLLCDTGLSHETVEEFILEENLFDGSPDTLIAENDWKKIASWNNDYHDQGEKITLSGIMN